MDKIIEEEIKKNGNTNLITNSGLNQQIFAIGDSHTIFFYNSIKIKEHWFFSCNLPLTIFTLLNNNLNIYNIGNIIGNGHELYNIKENDFVLMYFGFNDMQRNIKLHYDNNWQEGISFLINKYIEFMLTIKIKYNIIPIIPSIYPNPRPDAKGQNPLGTYVERQMYTIYANNILKELCNNNNIIYFDIYDIITDENGFIKENITEDKIHLDYNNKELREFIDNKIIELCKNNI
jgi:hypothetical protein